MGRGRRSPSKRRNQAVGRRELAMAIKIDNVTIEKFRAFRKMTVHGLGRVNLIVGNNNTGKSSFLEAVRILTTVDKLDEMQRILRDREEYITGPEAELSTRKDRSLQFSGLFYGFPEIAERPEPFVISADGSIHPTEVSVHVSWFSRKVDQNGNLSYEEHRPDEPEGVASIVITTPDGTRIHQIENLRAGFSLCRCAKWRGYGGVGYAVGWNRSIGQRARSG